MGNDSNLNGVNSTLKAALIFKLVEGFKYTVKISHKNTTAVNIKNNLESGKNVKNWLLRFDNPHPYAPFPHINISSKYTGFNDPHLKLPPGAVTVAKGGAYIGKALDWLCYITVVIDGIQLGQAIYKDHKNGTMNNTTECAVDKTGQYVGGFAGALIGKTIGSFLLPGIGPLVGAFALGCLGVSYGRGYGRELAPKTSSYIQNYWSERKLKQERERELTRLKQERERELIRFLYISRLHVNPFCD